MLFRHKPFLCDFLSVCRQGAAERLLNDVSVVAAFQGVCVLSPSVV